MAGETQAMLQLSFFVVFALLGTLLSLRLRQPYVVGLLIFGMLAGPNVLGLVSDKSLILTFSDLGAILLLFAVGIEFSVSRILKSGVRAAFITLFKMGILFALGYELAIYAGLDFTAALFVGAMISITSTAIMYKIVTQKGMAENQMMPLLFSMLIVEDLVAVAALTFFSSLPGAAPTSENKFISVFLSLGFLGAFYVLVRKPAASAILRITRDFNMEVMIFVSFSLCMAMSMVAQFFGLSPAIGAFLAGSIISSLPNSRKIEDSVKPLLLMFAALFFLSLGMQIDPAVVAANIGFAALLTAVFVLACFASVLWLLYSTGSSAKDSLFGASSMVVLGEFSLIIASLAPGQTGQLLLAAGSFGVVASATVSSFLLGRQHQLFEFGRRHMPSGVKSAAVSLSGYVSGLVLDFSPSGNFWKVSNVCWQCIRLKIGRIGISALFIVAARIAINAIWDSSSADAAQLRLAVLAMGIIPIAYYLFGIIRDLRPVLESLSRTIAGHKKNAKVEHIILRDLAMIAVLLFLSVVLNDVVQSLRLPSPFDFADDIAFLLALVFILDILRHAAELGHIRHGIKK